ncbi:hypothetical protein ES703_39463 [subsurface metagenome]
MEKRNIKGIFSLRRFVLLLKRDFSSGYRSVLIAMAAVAGFAILVSVLSMLRRSNGEFHLSLYTNLLFIGGFIVTSLAFKELHQNERSYFYLTLPGSRLEKFASKLLVTSLGYAVGTLFFYTAVAALSEGINKLIFGYGHPFFNPFRLEVLLRVAVYLVTQSIFLVGSTYYRKMAFLKTSLVTILLIIGFGIVGFLTLYLMFRGHFHDVYLDPRIRAVLDELNRSGRLEVDLRAVAEGFLLALKILFWAVMAPVCWVIGYLRLSETEV